MVVEFPECETVPLHRKRPRAAAHVLDNSRPAGVPQMAHPDGKGAYFVSPSVSDFLKRLQKF